MKTLLQEVEGIVEKTKELAQLQKEISSEIKERTVCEYDGDPRQWACQREEQCDDCFMVDHVKVCTGCEYYEHKSDDCNHPFIPMVKAIVKHDKETRHYEVVWSDGKPMTKVSDNILLK